ncbi:hypothetical protein GYO_3814 [Bacillus spizizenii TU-B-10]|uniref:Uncharacterized protein n=1 Tax=Bacillus spizizenii (strain DSM 15029 / JCM 12233 / NBRC 101239 / NRRL B-23049 / TU-B-10) TaxID=1052585 RepID=G4P157_BACS4|nr:hypothetical protein GYO_3814 [Bacillus spizizenii TU-B-10]
MTIFSSILQHIHFLVQVICCNRHPSFIFGQKKDTDNWRIRAKKVYSL